MGSGTTGSLPANLNVTNNAALVYDLSGNPTFGGVISGSGGLTQSGTGTLSLTNANTYSGGTMISSGSLSLNNANAVQNSTVAVNNNNSLLFNSSGGPTFNVGGLAGGGNILLADSSALTLSVGRNGTNTTYSGALSGTGGLTKTGSGILTLGGVSNTYSGSTTLAAGELSISASNNLSSSSPLVFNGGILQVTGTAVTSLAGSVNWSSFNGGFDIANAADVLTLSNSMGGPGSLSKLGPGTLLLTASNAYSGGTTISAGSLQVSGSGTLGTGPVTDNSALVFNLSGNPTYSGLIGGIGSLTQAGTGILSLLGGNSYSGGTTIASGSLSLNNANAVQNSTVTVNNNNSLLFSGGTITTFNVGGLAGGGNILLADSSALTLSVGGNGASTTYSGALSGTGGLTKTGTGILTIAGGNTYSGSTTLTAGELSISASNNLSPSSPLVFNGGILQVTGTAVTSLAGSVNWSSFNGGFDIANAADVLTLSNSIGGPGSLSKLGPGTLLLTAANGYSGGTTISAGSLQVSGSGTLGTGPVADNSTLVFNLSGNTTFAPVIGGSGSLTQAGTGILTLTGSNTYAGGTTISAGTLQVGNGASGASIGGTSGVLDNGSVVFNHGDNVTFSVVISGSGSLTQTGAGILTLLGNNAYSGGTTVSGGTLQVGNGTSGEFLGSPSVILSNSAALVFNHSDALTYSGAVSGNGSLTQTGPSVLTLSGSNTYLGGTTVSGGVLQVGNGTSGEFLGSPSVSLSNSAALIFNHSDAVTYSGAVSGNGGLTQTGPGLLTLLGGNTYSGGTTISAGTLQVGNGVVSGSITGSVLDNASLLANSPSNWILNGPISGIGGLTQAGPGILTLLGSDTCNGGTTISAGSLQVGNGGTAGYLTGSVALGIAGTLVLDRSDNLSISNTLTGAGGLVKMGNDTVTLTGNLSGFTGPITVAQGQLVLPAAAAPATTATYAANSGATLTFQNATFPMNGSSIYAMSGGTVQYNNATVTNAFLFPSNLGANTGMQLLSGSNTNTFNDVTINAGTAVQQNSPAAFTNVTNYGTISGSGGLTLVGGQNEGGGTITLSGANNDSSWGNAGTITILSGGLLNNLNSNLTSWGGGQITINSGGTLNADSASQGATLNLQDSLVVNNGTIVGTTNVGYGATLMGSGTAGTIYVSYGGTLAVSGSGMQSPGVVVDDGTISGKGLLTPAVTISTTAIVTPSSSATLTLADNLSGAGQLLETGNGQLILSGTNDYSGGTTVISGTMCVTESSALPAGTRLIIGAGGVFIFDPTVAGAPPEDSSRTASPAAGVAAVPEPGALALLSAALWSAAIYRRFRRRSKTAW